MATKYATNAKIDSPLKPAVRPADNNVVSALRAATILESVAVGSSARGRRSYLSRQTRSPSYDGIPRAEGGNNIISVGDFVRKFN